MNNGELVLFILIVVFFTGPLQKLSRLFWVKIGVLKDKK